MVCWLWLDEQGQVRQFLCCDTMSWEVSHLSLGNADIHSICNEMGKNCAKLQTSQARWPSLLSAGLIFLERIWMRHCVAVSGRPCQIQQWAMEPWALAGFLDTQIDKKAHNHCIKSNFGVSGFRVINDLPTKKTNWHSDLLVWCCTGDLAASPVCKESNNSAPYGTATWWSTWTDAFIRPTLDCAFRVLEIFDSCAGVVGHQRQNKHYKE